MKEPRVNRLFAGIVVVYLVMLLGMTALAAAGVPLRLPVVLALISGELTLLIPTVLYLLIRRIKPAAVSERWRLPIAVIPLLIILAYCILPLISLVNLISMIFGGENAVAPMLEVMRGLPVWVSLLCISVLPGVLEEFIFRGLIYSEYRKRRVWAAILTSALLFGLMHMNLNQFCYAFVMGVIFCLLYEGTGSVLASMLVHAVYNGNSVLMTYLLDAEELLEAAGNGSANVLEQAMGSNAELEMLVTFVGIAVLALIGLAAAGGLYVAIVKLCHREEYVKLLFQKNAVEKRAALACGDTAKRQAEGTTAEDAAEVTGGKNSSRKLWGPVLWCSVLISAGVILWDLLIL